jgi:S1-C subfamily serine protease
MGMRAAESRSAAGAWTSVVVLLTVAFMLLIAGCGLLDDESAGVPDEEPVGDPVARVMQSTVEVRAVLGDGRGGLGTGVVMSEDGLIVTNDHVIVAGGDQPASRITVVTEDGRRSQATVVHRAPELDLAYLRVDIDDLVAAQFQDDLSQVRRDDEAFAIGAPRHFDDSLVEGEVTRILRNLRISERPGLDTLIQTTAQLEEGFSGGPLADAHGRVIGINVAAVRMDDGSEARSLSIPSATVLESAPQLQEAAP